MNFLERVHLDKPFFYGLLALALLSVVILYSASAGEVTLVLRQALRLVIGFAIMLMVAQISPESLARWSPHIYVTGLVLLLVVLVMGATGKGAQRWLNLGVLNFQPSEIMKIGLPMVLAYYFSRRSLPPRLSGIAVAAVLVLIPTLLIARQPDLGTALLVMTSGLVVLFLAGMAWRSIALLLGLLAASIPLVWVYLHDYQKQRILTLFNPESDPLGSGYHIIQSMIAVGSGGLYGKGWFNSTQTQLQYLPESSTDFVFAVFAEEFGLIGIFIIFAAYLFVVLRGLAIAFYAQDSYARLLAGSLTLTFFVYFFVNIGMVTGILPVVGVPLPIISYGGSSLVTLMAAFGILMSIQTHRKIIHA
ncbi:MAG: rod shape-determining protein RodA [Acidiferrobacterales bacterium]